MKQEKSKVRSIFQKTKAEKKLLKEIKANLSIPFRNETIVHFNADSDTPTIVTKRQNKKKIKQTNLPKAA